MPYLLFGIALIGKLIDVDLSFLAIIGFILLAGSIASFILAPFAAKERKR